MQEKIAIILTTIERPEALKQSISSIIDNWRDNFVLMVGIQDDYESESFKILRDFKNNNPLKDIKIYDMDYNCGISMARNDLISMANFWNIPHILLTADSIILNDSIDDINFITLCMEKDNFDLCGMNLNNRLPWEGNISLIPEKAFELEFIDPKEKEDKLFVPCNLVRNFWVARTTSLLQVRYDEKLLACEHEDFFHRYNQQGFQVVCTNFINADYVKFETPEYNEIRRKNFYQGQKYLCNKYNLKTWITYKNLDIIRKEEKI